MRGEQPGVVQKWIKASLSGVHFGASGELVSLIYRMSAVLDGLRGGRVALLAKLVEDTLVFVHVEDTPIQGKTTSTPGLTGG